MFNFIFVPFYSFYTLYSALTPPSLEVFIIDGGMRKTLRENSRFLLNLEVTENYLMVLKMLFLSFQDIVHLYRKLHIVQE